MLVLVYRGWAGMVGALGRGRDGRGAEGRQGWLGRRGGAGGWLECRDGAGRGGAHEWGRDGRGTTALEGPSCIRMVQRNVSASSSNISASSRRQAVTRGQHKQKCEVQSNSRRIVACTNGLRQNSGWRTGVGSYAVAFPREELIAIL
mgnify:CR=1 FL=1